MTASEQVTRILKEIDDGKPLAAAELLPLVYDELRELARRRMARENPGGTLQSTALVHEAYMKLAGSGPTHWAGRKAFFFAAAEAMRRILIDRARSPQAREARRPADPRALERDRSRRRPRFG